MGRISRWNRAFAAAILLAWLTSANAQFVEAECGTWPPMTAFPDSLYMERARNLGINLTWREFATKDAIRAGQPPAPPPSSSTPAWTWKADRAAIARSSDLGIFISRFNKRPESWEQGVSDGFITSVWAFISTGTPKLIASTWLQEKNDRPVDKCKNSIVIIPVKPWSKPARGPDVSKVAAAVPPPQSLREADNALIAATTCRERWPTIIAASGEDQGTFLLPGFGEVLGGARLRSLLHLLPDEPVRWRRLKFLSSRDETLGVSMGRLENCDDPRSIQTYISAWVRDGKSWRLGLLAVTPGGS